MALQVVEGHLRDKKDGKEMHIRKLKADTLQGQVEHEVVKGSEGSVEYHFESLRMRPKNAISSGLAIQQGTDDNEFSQTIDVVTTSTTEIRKTSYSKRKGSNDSSSLGMICCGIIIVVIILWFLKFGK